MRRQSHIVVRQNTFRLIYVQRPTAHSTLLVFYSRYDFANSDANEMQIHAVSVAEAKR